MLKRPPAAENRNTNWVWRAPRVRNEPPTILEAVAAAQDLSLDAGEKLEIAAGLMGVSVEAVGLVVRDAIPHRSSSGGVIVERRSRRALKVD